MDITNDLAATPIQCIEALRAGMTDEHFPSWVSKSNNHVHTCFSLNPYTPAHATLLAYRNGLRVVGSVDHDSISAAAEMSGVTRIPGMGSVTGFEIRARFGEGTPLARHKLSNPGSEDVAYMMAQGVPAPVREKVTQWPTPERTVHPECTLVMAEGANKILTDLGLELFDPQADMVGISQYTNGDGITECHLLAAMASALIRGSGCGPVLVQGLDSIGVEVPESLACVPSDADNPHPIYDLLDVLKANYLDRIYIQPTDGLPSAAGVAAFVDSVGAVTIYVYLDDVFTSPMDDKKTEKFGDDFLDELFEYIESIGLRVVTCMLPRSTPEQLERIRTLAATRGVLKISGVDINQPCQRFTCEELRRPEFMDLNEATQALAAHKALLSVDLSLRLPDHTGHLTPEALAEYISEYVPLGRTIADGEDAVVVAARATPVN